MTPTFLFLSPPGSLQPVLPAPQRVSPQTGTFLAPIAQCYPKFWNLEFLDILTIECSRFWSQANFCMSLKIPSNSLIGQTIIIDPKG